jgi:hypothetical protein
MKQIQIRLNGYIKWAITSIKEYKAIVDYSAERSNVNCSLSSPTSLD